MIDRLDEFLRELGRETDVPSERSTRASSVDVLRRATHKVTYETKGAKKESATNGKEH